MDKSTERIIRFLQGYNININVLFFNIFEHNKDRLLSRAWMFDETVSKTQSAISRKWNGEYYFSYGITENRSWADAVKYGLLNTKYHKDSPSEEAEYIVKVEWQKTVPQTQAISEYGFLEIRTQYAGQRLINGILL